MSDIDASPENRRRLFADCDRQLGRIRQQAAAVWLRMVTIYESLGRPADLTLPGSADMIAEYRRSLQRRAARVLDRMTDEIKGGDQPADRAARRRQIMLRGLLVTLAEAELLGFNLLEQADQEVARLWTLSGKDAAE